MNEPYLPVQYRVEFHEDSFANTPVFSLNCMMAPFSFSVGQFVDPSQWPNAPSDVHYEIISVEHLITNIVETHVSHILSVCVKQIPRPS